MSHETAIWVKPDAAAPTTSTTATEPQVVKDNPFVFNSGDVRILVLHNGERIEGKASSHALCLASPVWRKFLFPPWKDEDENAPDPKETKQIDFTEDGSAAVLVLLNIAHLRFRHVPLWLPYEFLLQVAVLCDQYDCVDLVRPWLLDNLWLRDESKEAIKSGQEKWLFIAWVFARDDIFKHLANRLVRSISLLSNDEDKWMAATPMPPLIIENVLSCRKDLITSLLKIPYDILTELEQRDPSISTCVHGTVLQCDELRYGSLILSLRRCGLYPPLNPENVDIAVNELVDILNKVSIRHLPKTTSYQLKHNDCGVTHLGRLVADELAKPVDPLLDSHRARFQAQK